MIDYPSCGIGVIIGMFIMWIFLCIMWIFIWYKENARKN